MSKQHTDKRKLRIRKSVLMELEPILERGLSPESMKFVIPSPPRGTRRRPAKNSTHVSSTSPANGSTSTITTGIDLQPDTPTLAVYIEHVESLDPHDDEKPLRDFTKKWLSAPNPEWPISADPRLYMFMHTNRFYDPKHQEDRKELDVINKLRHDTEIAEIHGQPLQYNLLRQYVLGRVHFLAQQLILKKILAYNDKRQIQMVKAFRDVWSNREDYWQKKRTNDINSTPMTKETARYDSLNVYDDEEDDCVPATFKKKTKSKEKPPITLKKSETTTATIVPLRRKAEVATMLNSESSTSSPRSPNLWKRARIEAYKPPTTGNKATTATEIQTIMAAEVDYGITGYSVDAETEEHIRFAEQVLRSPTITTRPSTPQPVVVSGQSSNDTSKMIGDEPMTPESAIKGVDPVFTNDHIMSLDARSFNVPSKMKPSGTAVVAQKNATVATPLSSPMGMRSLEPGVASTTRTPARSVACNPGSNNPELFLILQKRNGTFDLSNKLLYKSYLPALDLSAFFALFSQRSGVPLADLNVLTFKLDFGNHPQQIEVIRRFGGAEEWIDLKSTIRKFFKFVRKGSPRETDFDIWVEIGCEEDFGEANDQDNHGEFEGF